MDMLCITSFGQFGKIKGLSFNKVYKVKFSFANKLLIINDFGKPQMVDQKNFVQYHSVKNFLTI